MENKQKRTKLLLFFLFGNILFPLFTNFVFAKSIAVSDYALLKNYDQSAKLILDKSVSIPEAHHLKINLRQNFGANLYSIDPNGYAIYNKRTETFADYEVSVFTEEQLPKSIIESDTPLNDLYKINDRDTKTSLQIPNNTGDLFRISMFYSFERLPLGFTTKGSENFTSESLNLILDPNSNLPEEIAVKTNNSLSGGDKNVSKTIKIFTAQNSNNFTNFHFPKSTSKYFEVEIKHSKPITILEMNFESVTKLYEDNILIQFIDDGNLDSEYYVYSGGVTKGDSYQDGIFGAYHNIGGANLQTTKFKIAIHEPFQPNNIFSNPDNDQDGVPNQYNNCVTVSNSDQQDLDGDKIGDFCDEEESRLTERYSWLPWLGIIIGVGSVGFILATTINKKS
jgi:hypothetical protein